MNMSKTVVYNNEIHYRIDKYEQERPRYYNDKTTGRQKVILKALSIYYGIKITKMEFTNYNAAWNLIQKYKHNISCKENKLFIDGNLVLCKYGKEWKVPNNK